MLVTDEMVEKAIHVLLHSGSEHDGFEACVRAALTAALSQMTTVPGAVWCDGGVHLIRNDSADDWCRERSAQRLYFLPAPPVQQKEGV